MGERTTTILSAVCIFLVTCCAWGQNTADSNSATTGDSAVEIARFQNDYSTARLQPALLDGKAGIAVIFEGTDDMHYYARAETGPGIGFELQVKPSSDVFGFGPAVFPKWHIFVDSTDARVEVYSGNFVVFLPIETTKAPTKTTTIDKGDVEVKITGAVCTSMICIVPDVTTLRTSIDLSQSLSWEKITLEIPTDADEAETARVPAYSVWFALGLALLAGLALNIMPCVWPILPIIVMKIISQAKKDKRTSVTMGLAFCIGILLFFACLAGTNIILQSFYDKTLSWGDHLRNPVIVTALAMLIIVMALFMFGVFTITVPSSIAGKSGSGKGHAGSVAMGFLAAVLSTPCSFGILTVAFVWAQGQTLPLGTLAIMVIGIGMAVPYAILTSIPGLLKRLPKAGRWMELFKQSLGFVLLIIAVKLIKAVPDVNKVNVLYFAVVLSFCVWMWSTWVGYGAKLSRKLLVRGIAVVIVILSFRFFFAPELVDWQDYKADLVSTAKLDEKPVLIKFTADWCTNCEVVDKFVYQRKDIAKLIEKKGVLAIKGNTTDKNQPATLALKNVYNEPGVPITILFLPGQKEPIRLRKLFFADELAELLEELPDK